MSDAERCGNSCRANVDSIENGFFYALRSLSLRALYLFRFPTLAVENVKYERQYRLPTPLITAMSRRIAHECGK